MASHADPSRRSYLLLVVVTFKSDNFAGPISNLLDEWTAYPDTRAVVVENSGSSQFLEEIVRGFAEPSSRLRFILNKTNIGFSHGVNAGVRAAESEWGTAHTIILLNPDVRTEGNTVRKLGELLLERQLAVASPILWNVDGVTLDRGVARLRWNRRRLFAEVCGVPSLARALGTSARSIPILNDVTNGLVQVDITSGAFMAIDREVFGKGLDTRLPMYLEDQEICHRAFSQQRRVAVVTCLSATHLGGASRKAQGPPSRSLRMMELAEAPCLSLADWAGGSCSSCRYVVNLGGVVRFVATLILSPWQIIRPNGLTWVRTQLALSSWFILWRPGSARSLPSAL